MSDRRPPRRCSARSASRNGRLVFFPCRLRRHSSRNKKASAHGRPPLRCGLVRCGPIVPGLIDSHRGRDGRGPSNRKGIRQWQPSALSPLPTTAFPAPSRPSTSTSRRRSSGSSAPPKTLPTSGFWPAMSSSAPAGRNRPERSERDYISVKLDDPSFPAPIYATLTEVQGQEGLQLIWSRNTRR